VVDYEVIKEEMSTVTIVAAASTPSPTTTWPATEENSVKDDGDDEGQCDGAHKEENGELDGEEVIIGRAAIPGLGVGVRARDGQVNVTFEDGSVLCLSRDAKSLSYISGKDGESKEQYRLLGAGGGVASEIPKRVRQRLRHMSKFIRRMQAHPDDANRKIVS